MWPINCNLRSIAFVLMEYSVQYADCPCSTMSTVLYSTAHSITVQYLVSTVGCHKTISRSIEWNLDGFYATSFILFLVIMNMIEGEQIKETWIRILFLLHNSRTLTLTSTPLTHEPESETELIRTWFSNKQKLSEPFLISEVGSRPRGLVDDNDNGWILRI